MKVKISDYLKSRKYSKLAANLIIGALNENDIIEATPATAEVKIELCMSAKYQTNQITIYHGNAPSLGEMLTDAACIVLEELEVEFDEPEVREDYTVIGYEE